MLKRIQFKSLFFVAVTVEIGSLIFSWDEIHILIKPLLIFFLLFYYFQASASVNKVFVTALVFCWLGDVLLLFDQMDDFFMAGLASFMIAHLLLIISYRQFRYSVDGFEGTQKFRLSFPIILAGSGLIVVLYPKLGDLKMPVLAYALILTVMVLQSIFRLGRTSTKSFWLVFAGAVSFMISDSLLAINKFYQPISNASVWIMATYLTAVYLIVQGVIAHREPFILKK